MNPRTPTDDGQLAAGLGRDIAHDLVDAGVTSASRETLAASIEAAAREALAARSGSATAVAQDAWIDRLAAALAASLAARGMRSVAEGDIRRAVTAAMRGDVKPADVVLEAHPNADRGDALQLLSERLAARLSAAGLQPPSTPEIRGALTVAIADVRRQAEATPSSEAPQAQLPAPQPARPTLRQRLFEFNDWIVSAPTNATVRSAAVQLGLVLLAVAIAFAAQVVFEGRALGQLMTERFGRTLIDWSETNRLLAGSVAYVLAGVLIAVAAPGLRAAEHVATRTTRSRRPMVDALRGVPRARAVLFALAMAVSAIDMLIYASRGETEPVRLAWLASLVLLVVSVAPWPGRRNADHPNAEHSPAFGLLSLVILAVIVFAGFWLRFDRVEFIPDDLHGDMASMGLGGRDVLYGRQPNLFTAGWAGIQMLAFAHEAAFMRVFGDTLFGLNMAAVTSGTLILLGWYLLVWRISDSHRLAALASAMLAINLPNLHFSRIATYIHPWLYGVWAMFFLVDGLRARRTISFVLSGLALAFCVQMYFSGRSVAFIMVALLGWALLFRRAWIAQNFGRLVMFAVAVLVGLGPSAVYIVRNMDVFMSRTQEVFLLNPAVMTHMQGMLGQASPDGVVREQIKRALLMFNYYGDTSTQFGLQEPMFAQIVSPFVALGFFVALVRIWRPTHALAISWWFIILVTGAILTGEAPFWPRLQGMPPVGALFGAIAIDRVLASIERLITARAPVSSGPPPVLVGTRPRAAMFATIALPGILLLTTGAQNWSRYVAVVQDNARAQAMIGRFLYRLPTPVAACMFSDPMALQVRETAFLAYPRITRDLLPAAGDGPLDRCPGPPLVWILSNNHLDRLSAIRQRWPNGLLEEHRKGGSLVFTSYLAADGLDLSTLTPEQARVELAARFPHDAGYATASAFTPDGKPFVPQRTFVGAPTSAPYEIAVGRVQVSQGRLSLQVAPVAGYRGVYDYARLVGADGREYKVEAENTKATMGDDFALSESAHGHWWLQQFDAFSGRRALVADRDERLPALTTVIEAPDGPYDLYIGSFTGDAANGAFGLGVSVR